MAANLGPNNWLDKKFSCYSYTGNYKEGASAKTPLWEIGQRGGLKHFSPMQGPVLFQSWQYFLCHPHDHSFSVFPHQCSPSSEVITPALHVCAGPPGP